MRIVECVFTLPKTDCGLLVAFARVTISGDLGKFQIEEFKVIRSEKDGTLYVQFPSKKVHFPCRNCREKNVFDAQYCNSCGFQVKPGEFKKSANGKSIVHLDIVHPVDSVSRHEFTESLLTFFKTDHPELAECWRFGP